MTKNRLPKVPPGSELSPPRASRRRTTRTVQGHRLVDDYGWLAQRGDDEAIAYLKAENDYAEAVLAHLEELEEGLYGEFVGRIKETDLTVPVRLDDFYYYSRTERGRQYPIYCRKRGGLEADEEVLLDLNEVASGKEYLRLGALEVSPDHRLLAFCLDASGGEAFELCIKDLATGDLLPDRLQGLSGSIAWANDSQTLLYVVLDAAKRPYKVFRHRLGDNEGDRVVYREDDEAFFVSIERARSRGYLLITTASAVTSEVHYVPADEPEAAPTVVEPRQQGIEYYVDHRSDTFYILSNDEAKNFRLLARPVGGATTQTVELIAHRDDIKLENIELFAEHLVVWRRREGLLELMIRSFLADADRLVELPEPVYTIRRGANPEFQSRKLRFGYTSMVTPSTVFECDMETIELEVLKVQEVLGGYDASRYVTGRLRVRSGGVLVPVTYVHRKDLTIDGNQPCLLNGYGAYGAVIDPVFSPVVVSLLDRGFVYAVAHVRGGGLLGKAWHEDGRMLAKKNTFVDLVAVAEHLIESGYSHPRKLALRGGSAGGLLVGAVLNMRPDLFAVAVAKVPFVDVVNTMLDPSIPLTVIEYEEWGNPEDEQFLEYMLSYSPYDNIVAQDYPALLVTAGLNDPRVQYWEPAKWVAKLRALKTNDNRMVLRTNMGAGHGGPSGRYDLLRERAQEYAFLLDVLGMAEAE